MVTINIKHNLKDLKLDLTKLSKKTRDNILPRSLNQVGAKATTATRRAMRKLTGLPASVFKPASSKSATQSPHRGPARRAGMVRSKKATRSNLVFKIVGKPTSILASSSLVKPKVDPDGLMITWYRRRTLFVDVFLQKKDGTGKDISLVRTKKSRYPIEPVYAYSLSADMVGDSVAPKILKEYTPMVGEVYLKKVSQYLRNIR